MRARACGMHRSSLYEKGTEIKDQTRADEGERREVRRGGGEGDQLKVGSLLSRT